MDSSRNGHSARNSKGASNGTEPTQRAAQRAFCIAALPGDEDLRELEELLRTAGVGRPATRT
jgi:hypothetical protein